MQLNDISGQIVDSAMKVHPHLVRDYWNRPIKPAYNSSCNNAG